MLHTDKEDLVNELWLKQFFLFNSYGHLCLNFFFFETLSVTLICAKLNKIRILERLKAILFTNFLYNRCK